MTEPLQVERRGNALVAACFTAMASPCEVLLHTQDLAQARSLGELARREALRIEAKYSRYRADSVIGQLNASCGQPATLDDESVLLMDFAARCHALSGGAFDVTSGVLRKAWRFDGSARFPSAAEIQALLARVGFDKLVWDAPQLCVPAGMEIDFGGIGKEYAVDRVLGLLTQQFSAAVLVNFGGDLAANRAPPDQPWSVGVERPDTDRQARLLLDFTQGGLATSGDTHRFIEHDGLRYGHILDVRTGWPVRGAPRSVTVAAGSCVEAGLLATLAMLQGPDAEGFLTDQGAQYWCLR